MIIICLVIIQKTIDESIAKTENKDKLKQYIDTIA